MPDLKRNYLAFVEKFEVLKENSWRMHVAYVGGPTLRYK